MSARSLAFALAVLATPALAAEPTTIILPTPVVAEIGQYLAQRPYGEVAQIMGAVQACIAAQVPDTHDASRGGCPAVTAALAAKTGPAAP